MSDNGESQVFDREYAVMLNNALRLTRSLMNNTLDKRRDLDHECGYPKTETLTIEEYRKLYDRGGIPNRIVGLWPDESWILTPDLYEDEDPDITTQFEQEFAELAQILRGDSWYEDEEGHPIWEYLNRVDVLSGIGHYGVLLIGIDDGKELEEPVDLLPPNKKKLRPGNIKTVDKTGEKSSTVIDIEIEGEGEGGSQFTERADKRNLTYLRAFDESLAQIVQYETDPSNKRFGQPTMYELTFDMMNAPSANIIADSPQSGKAVETKKVHWTRVIHIADNIESNEIIAVPRLRTHFNRCMDLEKLLGGSGEMYWRGALPATFFVTHPELGTDVKINSQESKDSIEQMLNTLQRWGFVPGVTPMQLAPAVVDPSAQIDVQLDSICIKEGCPKRIFLGSERGELASSQDERAWNKRVKRRQYRYVVPRLIVPLIDRLIQMRVLSQPKSYRLKFPDLDSLTPTEQADVALKRTQAMVAFIQGEGIQMMTEQDYLVEVMQLSDDDAEGIVERAMEQMVEIEEEEALQTEEERTKAMEDFEQQQKIIGDNRPAPVAGKSTFPPAKK